MNLKQIAELTILAFRDKGDEEYFYLIADALEEIGDKDNATRFRTGKWTKTDYFEAIDLVHGDLIDKLKGCPASEFVEFVRKIAPIKYLVDFIMEFTYCGHQDSRERFEIFCDPIKTDRFLGRAARAMVDLGMYSGHRCDWIVNKYRLCLKYSLYKEAAKWRKMGRSWWVWKAA